MCPLRLSAFGLSETDAIAQTTCFTRNKYKHKQQLEHLRKEQCRATKGGQTTHKANIYLGWFLDCSARAGLTFSLEISLRSELRSPNISEKIYVLLAPHLAPRTASRQLFTALPLEHRLRSALARPKRKRFQARWESDPVELVVALS